MGNNLVGKTLLSQYRVESFIDSGGMATVFRVFDLKRSVFLAMKVLHADLADEDPAVFEIFEREAHALEALAHPNIVRFYGLHRSGDVTFLLEQYIDGPTLGQVLKRRAGKPLPVADSLIFLKALSAALGYAHRNGLVHCDVKPGNSMIDRGGSIYLTDFGIFRHANSTETSILRGAGSVAYMAPEQCQGKAVSPATDVYALGTMLYEMLTGARPFHDIEREGAVGNTSTAERLRTAHVSTPPPDPREHNAALSEPLAEVVLKALAKKPSARFQSVQTFFEAACDAAQITPDKVADRVRLSGSFYEAAPVEPPPPEVAQPPTGTAPAPPVGETTRNRTALGLIVSAVAILVLLLGIIAFGGRGPSGAPSGGNQPAVAQKTNGNSANSGNVAPAESTATIDNSAPADTTAPPDNPTPLPPEAQQPTTQSVSSPSAAPPVVKLYPTYIPFGVSCSSSRLHIGDRAFLSSEGGDTQGVRSSPNVQGKGNVIGYLHSGEKMSIDDGPECHLDWILWKVTTDGGLTGWTPEGDGRTWWLIPVDLNQ